jgi:hypothetical protein
LTGSVSKDQCASEKEREREGGREIDRKREREREREKAYNPVEPSPTPAQPFSPNRYICI